MPNFVTYNPSDETVSYRVLSYLKSKVVSDPEIQSAPEYLQVTDNDLSSVSSISHYYWKVNDTDVVEMTSQEKEDIDKLLKLNDYADKSFEQIVYEVKQSIGSQEQADRINTGIKMYGYLAELQLRGTPDYVGFEGVIDMAVADPDCPLTADDGTMIKSKLPSY